MEFSEIYSSLFAEGQTTGYTPSHNKLDDLLLRDLPNEYYCFWRLIWRKTYGWKTNSVSMGLRDISKEAHITLKCASRIAWFFNVIQLIHYTPGKKDNTNSRFELFPTGTPNIAQLEHMLKTLQPVLAKEKSLRADDKNFRYRTDEFCNELAAIWKTRGGQVAVSESDAA